MGAPERCIRCDEDLAVDSSGYCGRCRDLSVAEVAKGFYELGEYLRRWDSFSLYCLNHGLPNPTG